MLGDVVVTQLDIGRTCYTSHVSCYTLRITRDMMIPHLDRQTRVEQPLLLEDQRPALGQADVHGAARVGSWLRSIFCETFRDISLTTTG